MWTSPISKLHDWLERVSGAHAENDNGYTDYSFLPNPNFNVL